MVSRRSFLLVALAVYVACALWATWPAVRHVDGHYLARPAAGHGQAAAGDHLQLGWAFWLVGHQLERHASPLADPYSFRPEAEAPPNLQGWVLGVPYWPLAEAFGDVWAYDLIVLLSFVLAGGLACWWLRSLGIARPAALVGGVVFCLMPYRVGQSTGHLLGLVSFLLPAMLLALERRRFALAGLALAALPLSGQLHLAIGAIPLALGYTWARLPRAVWWKAGAAVAGALAAGILVERWAVAGSIGGGRSFGQVERYSAELADLVTRGVGSGIEELVFIGWVTPFIALAGLVAIRRRRGLALLLGLAALVPCALALGANLPGYETLWRLVPGLDSTRVPERFMPVACLAIAALAAFGVERPDNACGESPQAFPRVRRCGRSRGPRDRPAGAGIRGGRGRRTERCLCRDARQGAVARAARLPAGHPLRKRVPRLRTAEPARATAGVLDDGAPRGRPDGAQAPWSLLRPGGDSGLARRPLRRDPPRAVRAERLLRLRMPGSARRVALRRAGWRPVARDGPISTYAR